MNPPPVQPTLTRLQRRSQFLYVRAGFRAARPHVVIEARRRAETGPAGLGFTASRKVGGAVIRNRARRRLKEAARQLAPELCQAGVDYVLVARPSTAAASWAALLDDVGNALIRLRAELSAAGESGPRRAPVNKPRRRPTKPKPASTESD